MLCVLCVRVARVMLTYVQCCIMAETYVTELQQMGFYPGEVSAMLVSLRLTQREHNAQSEADSKHTPHTQGDGDGDGDGDDGIVVIGKERYDLGHMGEKGKRAGCVCVCGVCVTERMGMESIMTVDVTCLSHHTHITYTL